MYDIYKNIEEYNPNKNQKVLITFDDIIAYILSNKKLNPIETKLLLEKENQTFLLFLSHNLISLLQKILE